MSLRKNKNSRLRLISAIWLLAHCSAITTVNAETLKKVYLDKNKNVHIVTSRDQDIQVTTKRNAASLKIAPDNETVAWLVMNSWIAEGDDEPGSAELVIYQSGKISSIECRPFIRDYWFWKSGTQIAIDCGGRRFAGTETLYDIKTAKKISSFYEGDVPLDKRPDWSNGDN
jgi:hypothetical protein